MGSFQYLRLYICPAPGITIASHMARLALGRQVLQSRFTFGLFDKESFVLFKLAESTAEIIFATESSIATKDSCSATAMESLALCDTKESTSAALHGKRTDSTTQTANVLINMYLDNLLWVFTTLLLFVLCVEKTHYTFQFLPIGERNAYLALAVCRNRHLHRRTEKVGHALLQGGKLFGHLLP